MELIKATRDITVGVMPPGKSEPLSVSFLRGKITQVDSDVWGALSAKKSVQGYLSEGLLEHVNAGRANAIAEGKETLPDETPPLQKAAEVYAQNGSSAAKAELDRAMDESKHGPTQQNQKQQRR